MRRTLHGKPDLCCGFDDGIQRLCNWPEHHLHISSTCVQMSAHMTVILLAGHAAFAIWGLPAPQCGRLQTHVIV
jgi:hypothetical protein